VLELDPCCGCDHDARFHDELEGGDLGGCRIDRCECTVYLALVEPPAWIGDGDEEHYVVPDDVAAELGLELGGEG
jgi:hypothetical protein